MTKHWMQLLALFALAACSSGGQQDDVVRAAMPAREPALEDLGGVWRIEGEDEWLLVVEVTYGAAVGNPDATYETMPMYAISAATPGDGMTHVFEAPSAPPESSFGADVFWAYDAAQNEWVADIELFALDELDSPDQVRLHLERL